MSHAPDFTDEDLVQFLGAPIPRAVPAPIEKAALKRHGSLRGLALSVFFFLFGAGFVSAFFPSHLMSDLRLTGGPSKTIPGRILSAAPTNLKINGGKVVRYEFEFTLAEGSRITGIAYTTGNGLRTGATVPVRYRPGEPTLACPEGARLSKAPAGGLLTVLIPLFGVVWAVWLFQVRKRTRWLLQNGALGDFRVGSIVETGAKINNQNVFKITLNRVDEVDSANHVLRWYDPALLAFVRERHQNQQAIFGLFDPAKPKRVLLPEAWAQR